RSAFALFSCCDRLSSAITIKPLGKCRRRTAELVLLRFCPPGPLARYVSTSHWPSNCASVSEVHVEREGFMVNLSPGHNARSHGIVMPYYTANFQGSR